jgi:hypothetical protein
MSKVNISCEPCVTVHTNNLIALFILHEQEKRNLETALKLRNCKHRVQMCYLNLKDSHTLDLLNRFLHLICEFKFTDGINFLACSFAVARRFDLAKVCYQTAVNIFDCITSKRNLALHLYYYEGEVDKAFKLLVQIISKGCSVTLTILETMVDAKQLFELLQKIPNPKLMIWNKLIELKDKHGFEM